MSTPIPNIYQKLLDSFPFLSFCTQGNNEFIGIIQNMDNVLCSMYIYENIRQEEGKKIFLELGDEWWWGSNRLIPINIILGDRFRPFRSILRTFNAKDFTLVHGHEISLQNIMQKRIKRRQIQLVRKMS
jgi:hypothetical protein